jgi:hypothetical protein
MGLRVKNWRQFQHYRDRNPPWIKLHFALLSSPDWVMLDDTSRVLAVACMLIASRNEGAIPDNPEYIKRVAYLNKTPNFKPLIDCGFLESDSDCKQMLADARPEERRGETEKRRVNVTPSVAFLRFWTAWPKSQRKGSKTPCWERWAKNDLDLVANEILAHVEAMKVSGWNDPQYIPAPMTYLNQKRWEGAEAPEPKKEEWHV